MISDQHVNLSSASCQSHRDRLAVANFTFELADPSHLQSVLTQVRKVEGVYDAYRVTADGKPELVMAFQDATAVFDSAGICVFTSFAWTLADVQPQVAAACEGDWSMERLNEVGERIWNMERMFNNAAGFTAKDDNLPPRLTQEPAKTGPAKGLVNGLAKMLPEYYQVRGWTPGGEPTAETRARLGL